MNKISDDIAETAEIFWQRGWAEANAGNISVNCTGNRDTDNIFTQPNPLKLNTSFRGITEQSILITSTGSRMRDIARDPVKYLGVINISSGGETSVFYTCKGSEHLRPSSELPTHLLIHQMLKKKASLNTAIVHCHATELIAISHLPDFSDEKQLNDRLFSIHPEAIISLPEGIGLAGYQLTGSEELAAETLMKFETHDLVLWPFHGCIAVGVDVRQAMDRIDIMNKAAGIYLVCRRAGFEPRGLTTEELSEIKRKYIIDVRNNIHP